MAQVFQFNAKYGASTTFTFSLEDPADADDLFKGDATNFAAGDVKISKDGGALANSTNLPTQITASQPGYSIVLEDAELEAETVTVTLRDATATEVFGPATLIIQTIMRLGRIVIDADQLADTPAVLFQGVGSGSGLFSWGGATGHGIHALGGTTSGDGLRASASLSGSGITATGIGALHGINATGGATGNGIKATGGSGSGAGISAVGTAGNSAALSLAGQGSASGISTTGGATGHGIHAVGGSASGAGFYGVGTAGNADGIAAQGQGSGSGFAGVGGATGTGMRGQGGATSGAGIYGTAGATVGSGIQGVGVGTGHGFSGTAGASGKICNYFETVEGTEPAAALADNAQFGAILQWLKRRLHGKSTCTATQLKVYKDDESTVLTTQTVSDDGATQTTGVAT